MSRPFVGAALLLAATMVVGACQETPRQGPDGHESEPDSGVKFTPPPADAGVVADGDVAIPAPTGGVSYGASANPVGPVVGTYYVDGKVAASGDGKSPAAAFKTIQEGVDAASAAGDVVLIRGGLYRESVTLGHSGAAGNPITLSRYGAETPIISGADPLGGWEPCTSAADAGGNPNWAKMFKATLPADYALGPFNANLHQAGQHMPIAIKGDGFSDNELRFFARSASYYAVPDALSSTSCTSAALLGSFTDASACDDMYIMVRITGNLVQPRKITSFDPAADRVTFGATSRPPFAVGSGHERVALYNGALLIDGPGQWAFKSALEPDGRRRVWCWPYDATKMDTIEYSTRPNGIDIGSKSHLRLFGLQTRQQAGPDLIAGTGIATVTGASVTSYDITIDQCTVGHSWLEADGVVKGYGGIYLSNVVGGSITHNTIHRTGNAYGLFGSKLTDFEIDGNLIDTPGHGGATLYHAEDVIFSFNRITNVRSTHANALTTYLDSNGVLFFGNRIESVVGWVVHQNSTNLYYIINQIGSSPLDGSNRGLENNGAGAPPVVGGELFYFNNSLLPAPSSSSIANSLQVGRTPDTVVRYGNNILHGGHSNDEALIPAGGRDNNLYTGYGFYQVPAAPHLWSPATGDTKEEDLSLVYNDPLAGDWSPRPGGPADGTGVDVTAYFPKTRFPDFDFDRDINKQPIDWTAAPRGAYATGSNAATAARP